MQDIQKTKENSLSLFDLLADAFLKDKLSNFYLNLSIYLSNLVSNITILNHCTVYVSNSSICYLSRSMRNILVWQKDKRAKENAVSWSLSLPISLLFPFHLSISLILCPSSSCTTFWPSISVFHYLRYHHHHPHPPPWSASAWNLLTSYFHSFFDSLQLRTLVKLAHTELWINWII